MGNWRTVKINGSCSAQDVPALRKAIIYDYRDPDDKIEFHCLMHTGGLAGLPMWAGEAINAVGNLAERDYTPDSVREALEKLSKVAPSLAVKVHCGDDWEENNVIATVTLVDGKAIVGDPEIELLPEIPPGQVRNNLISALFG